ncbi:MAG: hypothetical protein WC323_04705 [Patescibacteria group bacterium]|jgi:hypothetical protein
MKNLFLKIVLIFIVSLIGSWLFNNLFLKFYTNISMPNFNDPGFLVGLPGISLKITGFLLAYSFFISLLNFALIKNKKWLTWLILFLPLIFISFGFWQIFIWYTAMTIIGYVLGRVIRVIVKRVK